MRRQASLWGAPRLSQIGDNAGFFLRRSFAVACNAWHSRSRLLKRAAVKAKAAAREEEMKSNNRPLAHLSIIAQRLLPVNTPCAPCIVKQALERELFRPVVSFG